MDLSSVDLDGSHTTAIRGGEAIEYQGRKKRKATIALYLTDRQGLPLAMSEPVNGLFLNADAGLNSKDFREACYKKEINANICFNKRNGNIDRNHYFNKPLYDKRYAVERTNTWMDSYRSLLNRFDTTLESCKGFNYLAFMVIALKKIQEEKQEKSSNHIYISNIRTIHI
jgi:transposase